MDFNLWTFKGKFIAFENFNVMYYMLQLKVI
jgi:hypothetical protein